MKTLATFAVCALLIIGIGAASAATDTKPKAATVHSPESIECSKQADAKGLHGAERKKFRAKCKKELMGKATTTRPTTPSPRRSPRAKLDQQHRRFDTPSLAIKLVKDCPGPYALWVSVN